jgi:hypothetical protein
MVSLGQEENPIIAIFPIQTEGIELKKSDQTSLSSFLGAAIIEGGVFRRVPSGELQKALRTKRNESHKLCYDSKCQIELGRELAASKSLATRVSKIGGSCWLISELFDLKTQASDTSAMVDCSCSTSGMMKSIRKVAAKLKAWRTGEEPEDIEVRKPHREKPARRGSSQEDDVRLFLNAFYDDFNQWDLASWLDKMLFPLEYFYNPTKAPFSGGFTRTSILQRYVRLRSRRGKPTIKWKGLRIRDLGNGYLRITIDSYRVFFDGSYDRAASKPKKLKLKKDPNAPLGFYVTSILDK